MNDRSDYVVKIATVIEEAIPEEKDHCPGGEYNVAHISNRSPGKGQSVLLHLGVSVPTPTKCPK